MLDVRPILFVAGLLLTTLAAAMLLPAAVDAAAGHPDWRTFLVSAALTGFTGVGLALANRAGPVALGTRQMFVLTTLIWLAIAAFGAVPFMFSELELSYTDAFFEAMSGITTTGSTVITGLDRAPPGILLWRALLQWLGGIGIIVMAVAILPLLQVGGMQLFRMESDTSEKTFPRVAQIAAGISLIYLGLTAVCAGSLWAAGMPGFEAVAHAMTTIATGGFSTRDASVGHFASAAVDWIIVVFMLAGSLPFVLYLQAARDRGGTLLRDSQVRTFFGIVAVGVGAIALWQVWANGTAPAESVRASAFNVVSVITGTGYSTANYSEWGTFAVAGFFLFMFIGGCAGSTSCGIKVFPLSGAVRRGGGAGEAAVAPPRRVLAAL